ncbi:MAG: MFS transporter [Treponema sp.]|nr:MFS transporter [Treponema sp.]
MSLLGFLNSMRGVSFPLIKSSFNASYSDMGLMTALISFSAVCFCIIAGLFMNRLGLKKTVIAAFGFAVLGAGSLYFSSFFWMAVGFYLILQAGFGFFEISLNGTGVRVFTKKSGLMLNLLHFFYGVGAIGGPRFMGFMVDRMGFRWQEVYPLNLLPVFLLLAATMAIRFPGREELTASDEKPSFWIALKDPMVWLFGVIMGLSSAIEAGSVAWSGLYLHDVYGLDPSTTGAFFISVFYIFYTVSRFASGFVIEKTGYMRSVLVSSVAIFVLFAAAFSLGRTGIYLLPVVGFFIAIIWPTALAISVGVFKERAQTVSSAMISVAFTTTGLVQLGFGLSNNFLGAAWGYRSCVLYSVILGVLLVLLWRRSKLLGLNTR